MSGELMNPLLEALKSLGGSASIAELNDKIAEIMGLTQEQLAVPHGDNRGSQVAYRLAWTRTYLKKYGLLENSSRGVWALTAAGRSANSVDPKQVVPDVRAKMRQKTQGVENDDDLEDPPELSWRDKALGAVLNMSPAAFERLAQRILRESGFIQVEVTGQSGDGGIDGKGILQLGGLLSFHVYYQCKRWQGPVGASVIRDFRGAMVGRADKGLIITTGAFTKDAKQEATRDGAPPIDLVDGQQLVDKLKDLRLGIITRKIEEESVEIDSDWFANI